MARATAKTWCNVIAGLVVGVAPPALAWAGEGAAGESRQLAQLWGRSSKAHAALTAAVDCQQRGDYEAAASALQEAQTRQDDLTPQEREELARLRQANTQALQARREGSELLRRAEQAMRSGHATEAAEYIKRVAATEQYLAGPDKLRYNTMSQQLRLRIGPPPSGSRGIAGSEARAKLFQARAHLADGHWEVTEALANEVQRSGVTFSPTEDTPQRVLEDLQKMRRDPKALIRMARAALAQKDFDRAEAFARQAEQFAGWSMPWSDSPSRVLREVQSARAKAGPLELAKAAQADANPLMPPASQAPVTPAPRSNPIIPAVGIATPPAPAAAPKPSPVRQTASGPLQPDSAQTEEARGLLRQGRKALAQSDFTTARRCAEQARALRADLHWSDDTPERLLNDIARVEARRQGAAPTSTASASAPAHTKEEAVGLVQEGRVHLSQGVLDEATRCAQRARGLSGAHWGLFEDNPDALLGDIEKVRARQNKDESVRVLAEARRLYEQGDYEAADRAAYRAESLHGPYNVWELGDRPSKLHADIQAAREKNFKPKLPPAPLLANSSPKSAFAQNSAAFAARPTAGAMVGNDDSEIRARQILAEARYALRNGDTARARSLADQVRAMHVMLNRAGDDSPEAIYIAIAQQTGGALPQASTQMTAAPAPTSVPAIQRKTAHERAVDLMAQARTALREDRLLDARRTVLEAQGLGAAFAPGEETPEMLYQQIALRARQRVDDLVGRATETMRYGHGDMTIRLQKAEQDLVQARILVAGFGQDATNVDKLLATVRQQRTAAPVVRAPVVPPALAPSPVVPPAPTTVQATPSAPESGFSRVVRNDAPGSSPPALPTPVVPPAPAAPEVVPPAPAVVKATPPAPALLPAPTDKDPLPAPQSGFRPVVRNDAPASSLPSAQAPVASPAPSAARKLEMARLELQHGETGIARRLAEEVARDPQSPARDDALAVIRTVDIEEYNQKRLRVMRTFDAAWSAYLRRDYVHCGNMIAAIDTTLLDPARQDKLRDLMATPEMQPGNRGQVVQASGPALGTAPTTLSPNAAHAQASDDPDKDLLQRTQAMRQILFDKLRKEGLEVQSAALDKFRTGQQDAAIDMLQDYLNGLGDKQLSANQMSLLRRPAEARLKQLQLLREQEEFANRAASKHKRAQDIIASSQLAEQQKQKNVAELMKQFNSLYKEGKYQDASAMAMRAHDLDPDNPIVTAAVQMAQTQSNRQNWKRIKDGKEEVTLIGLNAAEKEGPASAIDGGIAIDPERTEIAHGREKKYPSTVTVPRHNDKEREIERQLSTPVTLNFTNAPLKTVIDDLRAFKGINMWIDEAALAEEGISTDRPVSIKLDQISLRSALNMLLQNMHLTYIIKDEVLQITTRKAAQGKLNPVTYQVADLVIPVDDYGNLTAPSVWGNNLTPPTPGQAAPSPITGPMSLQNGTAVGSPTGSSSASTSGSPFATDSNSSNGSSWVKKTNKTNEEVLIKLIMNTVEPQSWCEMGGPGTIDYFPNTMALVINQTPDIQEQVAELLEALRRLQDQEVAIEVRFISVSEDFYERIGVNFQMNFLTHPKTNFQQQLTSGVFQPDGDINSFQPNRLISGIQPNLALTPDLSIPLNVNTFAQSVPPFGGYPGIPGAGGVTLGLAFLSDIQVFLFMEAAQGDTRTNVMQAPKLTLFNGQTANITIADTQPFVSQVSVTPQQGIFTFTPVVATYAIGQITLTVQAVISADRRFVRMSLVPTISNASSPIVQLFPVVVPIFPNFDNTGTGQPVVFTQFLQQPRINTVNVQTTVAVPDGGTVLMGGLKRLSEGRTEFGPPILSKVPYIDRLFKNVGYGKETESLLIMVTPRIIIQEEEEERQTGFVRPKTVIP